MERILTGCPGNCGLGGVMGAKNPVGAGVSLDRVAQLLAHESGDATRIYTTPSGQDLQREVEKLALV